MVVSAVTSDATIDTLPISSVVLGRGMEAAKGLMAAPNPILRTMMRNK